MCVFPDDTTESLDTLFSIIVVSIGSVDRKIIV